MDRRWTSWLHAEGDLAERDGVAWRDCHRLLVLEPFAVMKCAVARSEVADAQSRVVDLKLGVATRDRRVEDRDVAGWRTSNNELHPGAQLVLLKTIGAREPVPHESWHCCWNMERERRLA